MRILTYCNQTQTINTLIMKLRITQVLKLALLIVFSSCSHKIVRTGYQVGDKAQGYCDVPIKKGSLPNTSQVVKLGEVKLKDSGASTKCNEGDAIRVLKDEACYLGADVVVITNEKRPDVISSCYRCTAEFYRFSEDYIGENITSDDEYRANRVTDRVRRDNGNNAIYAVSGFVVGFLIVFLILNQ